MQERRDMKLFINIILWIISVFLLFCSLALLMTPATKCIGVFFLILGITLIPQIRYYINNKLLQIIVTSLEKSNSEIHNNKKKYKILIGITKFIVFFITFIIIAAGMPVPETANVETSNNSQEVENTTETVEKTAQKQTKENTDKILEIQDTSEQSQSTVEIASPKFQKGLQEILNFGYNIANGTNVYYTKSKDYKSVYFFGALVEKNGQYYNAMWATNDMTSCGAGLVFSMNDYAIESSGMGDGRTNREPLSRLDDGYSRVNLKILDLMDNKVNKK